MNGIVHTASPVVWEWDDPSQIIGPAVKGANGILESASKFGKGVKRVVLTSSSVAIVHEGQKEGDVYDEVRRDSFGVHFLLVPVMIVPF